MSAIFKIKRGDTSPALRYALSPPDVNLTGASALFQMRRRRGDLVTEGEAVIESALPPIVRFEWPAGSTDAKGIYEGEFRITYADATIETFPNDSFIKIAIGEDAR